MMRLRAWLALFDRRVLAAVIVLLAVLVGYQVYAYRQQHRVASAVTTSKRTAAKLKKLTAAQCGQTVLLYTLLNALMDDSSPHFGSPVGAPTIPGARTKLIAQVLSVERVSTAALRKQGCKIP